MSDSQVPQLLFGCWFPRHVEQVSRGTTDVLGWIMWAPSRFPCLCEEQVLQKEMAVAHRGRDGARPHEAQGEGGPSSTLSVLMF